MKKVLIILTVIFTVIMQTRVFGALDTNLTWTYNGYFFQQTVDLLGSTGEYASGGFFVYANETHTGRQSFNYEAAVTSDVINDDNVKNGGWDKFFVYLAVDGIPEDGIPEAESALLPGYKDDGGVFHAYDSLFMAFSRYPATADATVKLYKAENAALTELASDTLTSEQRANGHAFNIRLEYAYSTDAQNTLVVKLDDKVIATLQDCDDLIDGRFAFQTKFTYMTATKAVYTETENIPPEPSTNPGTGESGSAFGAAAVFLLTVALTVVFKKNKRYMLLGECIK